MAKCVKCGGELEVEQIIDQYDSSDENDNLIHITEYQGFCLECNTWHRWETVFIHDHDEKVKFIEDDDDDDDFPDYGDDIDDFE